MSRAAIRIEDMILGIKLDGIREELNGLIVVLGGESLVASVLQSVNLRARESK
jgi:hypothetical protein